MPESTEEHIIETDIEETSQSALDEPVADASEPDGEEKHSGDGRPRRLTAREEEIARFDESKNDISPDKADELARLGIPAPAIEGEGPAPSKAFRFAEAFMAATAWPAAIGSAIVVLAYCTLHGCWWQSVTVLFAFLLSAFGSLSKKSRAKAMSMEEGRADIEDIEIKAASRKGQGIAALSPIVASIIFLVLLVLLSFIPMFPIPGAWLLSWIATFLIGYSASGQWISACAPYADVYDVELLDGSFATVLSFDILEAGGKRPVARIDGANKHAYIAMPSEATRTKQSAADAPYELDACGSYVRRVRK